MRFVILAFCAVLALAGCETPNISSSNEEVARAAYVHDGPKRLTLYTMINARSGAGAHTSMMINGSQRVMWDPAGSFAHETIPEQNDLLYGITPVVEDVYTRYHARKTYYVRIQTLDVSPELAEKAIALTKNYGAVPAAYCAKSTSEIMAQLFPGQIRPGFYPLKLSQQFAKLPGVTQTEMREYDSDDNSKVLAAWDPSKI
ncbi:hypothetical protein OO012_07930 [Rhodobacteraceae bacterium KMM 6894]|nr:hypothetical protein [Rhodobacteraceae bacterium KMM 6894]